VTSARAGSSSKRKCERPPAPRRSTAAEHEDRVEERAPLLGEPVARRAEIERILPAASRFPPNEEATRSLAGALSTYDMSQLSDSSRVLLAGRLTLSPPATTLRANG
jgi:hypothetical protein